MRSQERGSSDRFKPVMQLNMAVQSTVKRACDPSCRPLSANDPIVTLEQHKTVIASGRHVSRLSR
jgi:hypothetical protein